jgi:hypothetical protein
MSRVSSRTIIRRMARMIRASLALLLLVVVAAGCGTLDQASLQGKIRSDVNRYVGTDAVKAVQCKADTTGSAGRYVCVVIPTNGRNGVRVVVAVHGSKYSILTKQDIAK